MKKLLGLTGALALATTHQPAATKRAIHSGVGSTQATTDADRGLHSPPGDVAGTWNLP